MAEEFEDSYSSEALQNMAEYMFSFGDTIKDIGSEDAFKNALFGMKVMVDKKPRRIADLGKVMIGTKPRTLDVMPFAREHVELIAKEIKANNLKNVKFYSVSSLGRLNEFCCFTKITSFGYVELVFIIVLIIIDNSSQSINLF